MRTKIAASAIALIAVLCFCMLQSCGPKTGGVESNGVSQIPMLSYWDQFDFSDSLAVFNPDSGEQRLVDFIDTLRTANDSLASEAIHRMLGQALKYPESFAHFVSLYDKYLYDPNSPMRNELLYEPVLQFLIDEARLDEADSFRYTKRLELLRKNQVGMPAIDFKFGLAEGGESRLYDLEAPYLLLFFYEPGCSYCEVDIDRISGSPYFQQLIKQGRIQVLGLYASGDEDIWKGYQTRIPGDWVNGIDRERMILGNSLYDLKASPTLYLLDSDKRVLLKDTDLREVILYLNDKT